MDKQMWLASFKPSAPISVFFFLYNFKAAWDRNGLHEDGAIWLFQRFMKYPAKAGLAHSICATKEVSSQKKKTLTTYCQLVNYLLSPYATDDVIAEIKGETTNFKYP